VSHHEKNDRFIGLDVHKDFISVAIADEGRGEVESYGEIVNTAVAVSKLARHLVMIYVLPMKQAALVLSFIDN